MIAPANGPLVTIAAAALPEPELSLLSLLSLPESLLLEELSPDPLPDDEPPVDPEPPVLLAAA